MTNGGPLPRPLPGPQYEEGRGCRFTVWAPFADRVDVHLVQPAERLVPLTRGADGYHTGVVNGATPGSLYLLRLDGGRDLPDPASRFQPRGVSTPSCVVDPRFDWSDGGFSCPSLPDLVFYEIHVGAFTPEGTFDAIIPRLDALKDLGITAIELMPVSQFPGPRNWGYDGVHPYAVQNTYGGPGGLKRLVDACHRRGLAVALDVVYNHVGPEGNYLAEFGPYFTSRYRTPWGEAVNFDGPDSDEVRRFFIGSALVFLEEFHIDVFRVDAIHAIVDTSAVPFLMELAGSLHEKAAALGRRVHAVAESNLNDARVIFPIDRGGLGFDAQWSDDFHHALHTILTGERSGYYVDFGRLEDLAIAFRQGFVYTGRYSPYRRRRHGNSPAGCSGEKFVVATQTHDQVGNRARGDRLAEHLSFAQQKLSACVLLLAPYVPLLFMGQEYGETAPFLYFTSHSDPGLIEAVRDGRRREFASFGWKAEEIPDPQDETTFLRSRLTWERAESAEGRALLDLHRDLLRLRREVPALRHLDPDRAHTAVDETHRTILVRRTLGADEVAFVFAFGGEPAPVALPLRAGRWRTLLDTEAPRWLGWGSQSPEQFVSNGAVRLALAPASCLLFVARGEENA